MQANLLLCDAAYKASDGKLYVHGGGFSILSENVPVFTVAIFLKLDWTDRLSIHEWTLRLLDSNRSIVNVIPLEGTTQPFEITGSFEVTVTDGIPVGSPIDWSFCVNILPGKSLISGNIYYFQFSLSTHPDKTTERMFYVRGVA